MELSHADLWFEAADVPASLGARLEYGLAWDGNHTDYVQNWVMLEPGYALSRKAVRLLTQATAEGDLAWVVFVPVGYRL